MFFKNIKERMKRQDADIVSVAWLSDRLLGVTVRLDGTDYYLEVACDVTRDPEMELARALEHVKKRVRHDVDYEKSVARLKAAVEALPYGKEN